ncbi:TetR/AcrR family transcriptional regulator [Microbacterium amylolyticum]|uniref:AcrR family transcriptional regulator n=1 Tax=Microbacterium amylolyticum TaxID=936337 RepID=A0ABS4ZIQ4_9MICO|nr:TetR/AcrR family transcriptional regulator [Microbacterium amylolyticum]MBP2436366.1 AcrR family transcriptional regulator [Microbacterium amylolyticum]
MPLPRFECLPRERRRPLLEAALDEFSARGFADASLNRIIQTAGTSKGSLYYYFEDKNDLYLTVLHEQLRDLLPDHDSVPIPVAADTNAFWAAVEKQASLFAQRLLASPRLVALIRDALATSSPRDEASRATEQMLLPWWEDTIAAGQTAGAIRTDLPRDLLIAVAMRIGQAVDTWLLTQPPETMNLDAGVREFVAFLRRAFRPETYADVASASG